MTPKPKKPKKPGQELKPLKIIGCQLVGGRFNEHGELIGEELMTDPNSAFIIYAPDFPKLKQKIEREIKAAEAIEAARDE